MARKTKLGEASHSDITLVATPSDKHRELLEKAKAEVDGMTLIPRGKTKGNHTVEPVVVGDDVLTDGGMVVVKRKK